MRSGHARRVLAVGRAASVPVDLLDFDDLPSAFRERIEREGTALRGR